jgi:hypothetical protein
MILDPAVDQPDFQALILSTQNFNWLSRHPLSGFAYSLYSKPKTAYHLPAKHHHRLTMESCLGSVLDIFVLINSAHPSATPQRGSLQPCKSAILPICLMRIPQRDPEL